MGYLDIAADVEVEKEQDRIGGFQAKESGLYMGKVKAAFFGESSGGAICISLSVDLEDGSPYSEDVYITNRNKENFYIDKNTGKKRVSMGMAQMDSLAKLLTGKPLSENKTEKKFHKIWDKTQGEAIPQERDTLVEWTGLDIGLGIIKILENKNTLVDGKYVPTADTRTSNRTEKMFNGKKQTLSEKEADVDAAFYIDWAASREDYVQDKTVAVAGGPAATAGAPATTAPLKFD